MKDYTSKWISIYLFLTMLTSSFVSFEPAAYDLLMFFFIGGGLLLSLFKITKEIIFPVIVVCLFLISNLISMIFVTEIGGAIFFSGVTFYLALTWGSLVLAGQKIRTINTQLIINGYLITACMAASLGILAYFQLFSLKNDLLMFGRVKVFFKDPNVFGPFLVAPALYAIGMTEVQKLTMHKKIIYFVCFLLLGMGIVLSFSRAAWGNFAISILIYLFVVKKSLISKRIKTFLLLLLIAGPLFMQFVQSPSVEDLFEHRLGYQGYDDNRFHTQKAVFITGLSNPLGIGGGQSDYVVQKSPHNLYARVFTENGVLGVLSLLLLLLLSVIKSYKSFRLANEEFSVFYLVIFASLVGLAFNSFFVDTLHWRHFWLLMALAWFPIVGAEEERQKT